MHAIVLREFGPASNLRYETVEGPAPASSIASLPTLTVSSALVRPGWMRDLEERSLSAAGADRLTPLITRFRLADAATAHAALEARETVGKVVLTP